MQKRHILFILLLTVIMPWVSRAQETLTVYEGTSTSNVIPAYILYFDDFTRSQFVIPAADLEIMSGSTITSIKFYTTNYNVPYTTVSSADVFLKEVDYTAISAFEAKTNIVYQGTLDVVSEDEAGSLTIELATPYTYGGGNLLVGCENTTDAGWKSSSFYGTSVTGASIGASNGSSLDNVPPTQRDFIPKTTFTYDPVPTDCDVPASLAVSNITPDGAKVTWEGEGSQWNLRYKASTDAEFTEVNGLTDKSYTLSGLTGNTTYSVGVQTVCTGSTSFFKSANFSTIASIPLAEEFGTSIPTGWSMYKGLLSTMVDGTALTPAGSAWSFGIGNSVFDNHARVNIYGTSCQNWLIMPTVRMENNVQLTFDLALTVYSSGSNASPTPGNQADDKFAVLITTDGGNTWTILCQWDNVGSEYMYDNIPNTGTTIAIDLSSYAGQSIAIAFYGESTINGGDNNLHIDNVNIDYIPACPAPDVVVNNVTNSSAAVAWTGFSDSYTVSIREPSHYEFIDENFETNALPRGWTNEGDAAWTVGTGDHFASTGAHSGSYNAKITYVSRGNVTYLVTPAMNLSGKSDLNLNLWYINRQWSNDIDEFGIYYRINGSAWNEVFSTTAAHSTWTELSVLLPTGAYAANCQIGFKFTDNYGYGVAIDDVTLGEELPDSEWQLVTTTAETNAIIPNLNTDTYYEVKVQGTCGEDESEESIVAFSTLPENQRVFVTEGNWNNAANWSGDIPNINNEVIVRANAIVPSGCVAEADIITFEGTPTPTLTIADGGQLKTNNNVTATVKKNITGYGMENVDTNNGYYLIAAPTTPSTTASDAGLITTTADNEPTYDLYSWDRTATDEEWQNTKNFGYYYLYNGNGYLYANLNDMEMSITGTMLRSDEPVTMTAYHDSIAGGWNLFGNPFTCNAYVYRPDGAPMDVMFFDTNGDMVTLNGGPVAPMQGFFVKVTETTTVVIKSVPAYVDLGLPSGLLWATCNVGATTPEGNGDYFAWGETQPKEVYNWSTYQYCDGNRYTLTKYCGDSIYGNGGFTDSLITLLPEDDAATANMGAGWRMPTSVEWAELYNNTTNTWTTQNGVYGRLFTAPNGSTLFLPDAGYRYDGDLLDAGSIGYYWSSSLNTADPDCAKHFGFNSDYYSVDYNGRRFGYAVRAVRSSSQSSSFTATTEHQGGRTILDPNNGQVNWTAGDQMVIGKDNGETAVFTLQSGEGTIEGVFAASNGFGTVGTFIAAYPSDAVIENGKVTFNLPSTQAIAEAETFANGANPMVACSDDNNLSFKNLCGGLGIRLKGLGAHVTAIRITSMDTTEKLWGTYEVSNCSADEPSLTVASGNQGTNVITLTCDVNLTTAAKTFFVMLPPGTLAAGFTVEVFDGEEILTTMETTSDAFSVERNSLKFFNEILIDIDFDGNVEIPSDLNSTDIVVTNLGEDAIPDENGDFFIGYSTTLTMKNATNNEVIYMSIPSVDNDMAKGEGQLQNYDLNAKETALYYALTVIPFALCQTEDATFNSIKDVLYDLACVKALENAIEQSVNQNGYLRSEDIEDELNALWDYLREELLAPFMETQSLCSGGNMGHIVLEANGNSRLEQPQLSDNGRYRGIRLDLESAVFNESSDTWTINLTGYSDNGVFIGMQKGSIGNDGKAYPIEERPHYFLPPMNMGKFMGTFTSFSGIASYFSDTWRLFFEDGFGFDDMTWDKAKLENISFELNRNEDALVMLSPKDNQATAVVNGVYAIMQVVGMALDDILTSRGYSAFFTSLFSNQELCAKISGIAGHPENFQTAATSLLNWAENLFLTGEFQQFINPKYNLDKILDKITSSTSRAVLEYAGNTIGTLASWYLFDSFFFTVEAEYNSILPTVSTTSCEVLSPTQAAVVAELESMGTHSVTEMGVCYSTTILPTVNNNCVSYSSIQTPGSYQCQLNDLQPNTTYYARAYAKCPLDVVVYGNRVRFTTGNAPTGFINGLFTINGNGDQVQFSQGNLQYQASTNTWRFAENQWDYVGTQSPSYYGDPGGTVSGSDNVNISQTYDGWIDLFGWGTSGYNNGAVSYQPWSTIQNYSDYFAYGIDTCNLYDQTGQADWGYNAISNGGNTENCGWRTLTQPEWNYVINSRNTSSGIRYAKAKVNNVNGMILLPDNWNTSYYSLNNTNSASDASYSDNVISATQWVALEQHGVVFLPAAGYRYGTSVGFTGSEAAYWSASYYDSNRALYVYFDSGNLDPNIYNGSRSDGQSVRLVRSGSTSFIINATANPVEGGIVSGGGTYQEGTDCSLTAMANEGYSFTSWTENGEVVSTNFTYSFTVSSNRNLVANFVVSGGSSHEYVDLGLPSGLLWATCNVGAESPEDYGDYFAWGETQPKDTYDWSTYQYCNGSNNTLTKYCNDSEYGYNGFTDNLPTLLPEDDAATANWGSDWRMPTSEEWEELLNNTIRTRTTQNGVNGWLFTASNGNSLFLPAAGQLSGSSSYFVGSCSFYWSSSLFSIPDSAWHLYSYSGSGIGVSGGGFRGDGQSVRAVREN